VSDVVPQIPPLEQFPVTGDSGAVTVQAGGLNETSRLLGGQGQQIAALSAQLHPSWSGEAASGFQSLSANVAGAFREAATTIEGAAQLMLRYAADLERLQREGQAAKLQSDHWHQEITTWTGRVTDAQTALTKSEGDLTTAQGQLTAAAAQGVKGAAAAAQAGAATTQAKTAVRTAQDQLTRARLKLTHAHEQFTHWQDRARTIRDSATTEGQEVSAALLLITVVPPPLPGAPDYPLLQPSPGIQLNDDPGDEEDGGKGKEGGGGKDEKSGSGKGEQGQGKGDDGPPNIKVTVGPDGKIVEPERPPTKPVIGDPKQEEQKAAGRLDQPQQRHPLWVILLDLYGKIFHGHGG
jgi:hypothetical protein